MVLLSLLACGCPPLGDPADAWRVRRLDEASLTDDLVVARSVEDVTAALGSSEPYEPASAFDGRQLVLIELQDFACDGPTESVDGVYTREDGLGLVVVVRSPDCGPSRGCDDPHGPFVEIWSTPVAEVARCAEATACELEAGG